MPIDTPNYLNTHGYFNSESIHFLKPRDSELKCPGKEIIKATTWGPRHNILPWLVALSMGLVWRGWKLLTIRPSWTGKNSGGQVDNLGTREILQHRIQKQKVLTFLLVGTQCLETGCPRFPFPYPVFAESLYYSDRKVETFHIFTSLYTWHSRGQTNNGT